ncbi:MAG: hypothetical protein SGJ10_09420 [Bacteroidota bacterium]|nr:hypothetical protein [Bacteroidota bacterium]
MEKVFVDTEIILDLLSLHEPFYKHAAHLFSEADRGKLKLYRHSIYNSPKERD